MTLIYRYSNGDTARVPFTVNGVPVRDRRRARRIVRGVNRYLAAFAARVAQPVLARVRYAR
jgi:hypothetical protein